MRKSNLKTRLMAVLLTLCMALTFMPTTSFAEGTNEITTVDIGNVWKNLDATKPVAFTAVNVPGKWKLRRNSGYLMMMQ